MAWKFGQKLWNWVTGKGWKTNDELAAEAEAAEAAEANSSSGTRVIRAKGSGTTSQDVILTLRFYKKNSNEKQTAELVKEININKNTASNSFIFNNNSLEDDKNGIIKYEISNESFDWSPNGILVSPASSDAIDENFYKVFKFKLDTSLSKSIIDNIYIHSRHTSSEHWNGSDVFSVNYNSENVSINFDDEEFALSDDEQGTESNKLKRRFAGKILANDEISYPLSNNILSFEYYTKYSMPNIMDGSKPELTLNNTEESTGVNVNYYTGGRSRRSAEGGSDRTHIGTNNRSAGSRYSTGTVSNSNRSVIRTTGQTSRSNIKGDDVDSYISKIEDGKVVEMEYSPLKTVHLYIDIVLDFDKTSKMNIDIFPPIAKDKLTFIPNISEINSINFKKGTRFYLDIHSFFEINSLVFSYALIKKDKDDENNTAVEKNNYTIIGKKDVDAKWITIFGKIDNLSEANLNYKINVFYEELREINIYNYTLIFNKNIIDTDDDNDAFIETTLSLDQSGAEHLLNIDRQKTEEELEDLDCAIKVFSNNTAQGNVSDFALENILIGKKLSDGTLEIARYKLKEGKKQFGEIHIFYGNIHIRKTGDVIKYSTKIQNDELIVYIKYNPFAGYSNQSFIKEDELILYNYICVNMDDVIELNLSEIDKSSPVKITNVANISQDSNVVFSSNINIPLVNYSDQTVFIDSADNSNKLQHYTNITKFNENDTTSYLGVRAYKRNTFPSGGAKKDGIDKLFNSEFANLNINGLTYNTNATLVLLTPYTTQEIIYSFRNGRQTMQVKKSAMDFNYDKINKQLHVSNLLPSYLASYEYLVDGTEDKTGNYNISFYGIAEHKDWVKTNLQYSLSYDTNTSSYYFSFGNNVESNKSSYLFTISYIEKEIKESKSEISLLENVDENYPLYNNIYITDYSTDNNGNIIEEKSKPIIFEEQYTYISNKDGDDWKDSDNIYERKISYTKLAPNSISLDDFKTVVKNYNKYNETVNPNNGINKNGIYYKYSSISKEYNEYTIEDIENINSVPYNLYYRSEYYLKKAGINKDNKDDFITKGIYFKNWEYSDPISEPTISDGLVYLHYKNGYTYLPLYLGIKYDGSVQYYSGNNYYLIDLNNLDYRKEERPSNDSIKTVYLKQNYTRMVNLNRNKYDELYNKKYKFYRQINPLKFIKISDKETIYSLDLSGDVVYADSNKKIISKNDISYVYYYATTDADNWTKKTEPEIVFNGEDEYKSNTNILRNGNKSYLLNSLNCGEDALGPETSFKGVYYIVDFGGEYIEVSYPEVYNSLDEDPDSESGPSEFFINKEGYNEFNTSDAFLPAAFINNKTELEKILNYGYNFEFYLKGISKIDIDKVKEIIENHKEEPLYINVSKLFENCENVDIEGVIDPEGISINGTNNSNSNPIKLAEINKYGENAGTIIEDTYFKYYSRKPVLKPSSDIHNNINKKYYTKENYIQTFGEISLKDNKNLTYISKIDDTNRSITFTSASGIMNESNTPNSNNIIRKYNFDTLKFYYKGISNYTTINLGKNAEDIISYLQPKLIDNNPLNDITYSYDILMSSKFFYPSYVINNGIKSGKDGSYYVNVSVFDGKSKFIDKQLYLNPHIYTVTNYKYTYFKENEVPVTKDMDLSNVSENEYKNYFVKNHTVSADKPEARKPVSETDRTPEWWQSYCLSNKNYSLVTTLVEVGEEEYDGRIIYNENNKVYQFFDDYTNRPYTLKYNNNIYGLLFKDNPYNEVVSDPFIISYTKCLSTMRELGFSNNYFASQNDDGTISTGVENHQKVYQIIGEQYNGKTKQKENDGVGDGDTFLPEDADFLKAKHYYENIDLTEEVSKIRLKYIPHEFEYEIVPLQEFIYKTSGIDDNVFQVRDSIPYELKEKNSLELSNAKKINFTGTYTWIAPEFSYISTYKYTYNSINPEERTYEYSAKKVISRSGYWSKDYIEEEVPIKINAYNFYPKDEISSVNISYNFIPFSYVKTAEIYHPEISYDYLINDIYEYYKYTYIINGIEKDYPLDGKIIVNPDNSYSGIIKVLDFPTAPDRNSTENNYPSQVIPSDELSEIRVKLYKKLELGVTPNIKNIVHQKEHTSYNWYSYLQATPLTNEKIPYLYKKEIIPGGKKKVQYWNKGTNSYAVKEVDEYKSYWAYEYTYEVVPFKVASYIFTDDLRISNFYDLGAYILELKDGLNSTLSEQAEATKKLNSTMTQTGTDLVSSINNASISWNENYSTQSSNILNSLSDIKNEYNSSLSNLSNILDSSIDDLNAKNTYSLNSLNQKLNESINKETEVLDSKLSEGNKISYEKFTELSTYIHDDLIGEDSLEIIKTNTELTYSFDIKKNESILNYSNEETVSYNKDSLAKMFKDSLYGYFEHSKISYNEDGTFTKITYSGDTGIAEILANLTVIDRLPDYNQFMVKLVPAMFANVDFENYYEVQYDAYGNVIGTQKRNPINVAKASIYRADTLWKELKKKGIVE